jgi:hypothetical protein
MDPIRKSNELSGKKSGAHSLRKAKKEVELTAMTSSGAPFTIWKSFKMKPEGTSPCWLGGGELSSRFVSFSSTRVVILSVAMIMIGCCFCIKFVFVIVKFDCVPFLF